MSRVELSCWACRGQVTYLVNSWELNKHRSLEIFFFKFIFIWWMTNISLLYIYLYHDLRIFLESVTIIERRIRVSLLYLSSFILISEFLSVNTFCGCKNHIDRKIKISCFFALTLRCSHVPMIVHSCSSTFF